jgi:hypothetical protein
MLGIDLRLGSTHSFTKYQWEKTYGKNSFDEKQKVKYKGYYYCKDMVMQGYGNIIIHFSCLLIQNFRLLESVNLPV